MPKLSQETLAILGVGIGLAALILTGMSGIRGEIQAVRDEIQAVRTEMQVEIRDVRAEGRADREASERRFMAFERHIIRLTEQQGILGANLESVRDQLATTR